MLALIFDNACIRDHKFADLQEIPASYTVYSYVAIATENFCVK